MKLQSFFLSIFASEKRILTWVMSFLVFFLFAHAQAATLTVTKTADTNDSICDADCSLREAISTAISGDTIDIPAGVYTLNYLW